MFNWVDQAISEATDFLVSSAGLDAANDNYMRGVISALRDIKNKLFLENGETE